MKAVAELNYYPNLHARTLAGGKSRTLGMIVSNMENPFFFDIYRTLEATAHARGYEVVIANTDYRPEQLVKNIRLMIGRRVAGLAVEFALGGQPLGKQLRLADARAARFAVVIGPDDRARNEVQLKDLGGKTQRAVPRDGLVAALQKS